MRLFGRHPPTADLVLGVAVMGLSGLIWRESLGLPEPQLEPIGPAAFPQAISVILAAFALAVLVAAFRRPAAAPKDAETDRRPGLGLFMGALTIAYVAAMDLEWLGFRDATMVFLAVLGAAMFDFARRALATVAVIAIVGGVGLYYLFTTWVYVDLP